MENKEIIRLFNDLLVNNIDEAVKKNVDPNILLECKATVILGTGVHSKVEEILKLFKKINKKAKLIIVAKRSQYELIKEEVENQYIFIEWNQKFNLDIIKQIQMKMPMSEIDSLIYLCKESVDLRDINIFQIMLQLKEIRCFSFSSGEELNYYTDILKLYSGLECYESLVNWVNDVMIKKDCSIF